MSCLVVLCVTVIARPASTHRLVAKSLWCKTRPKLPKSLSRPARHYLLKKSDVEHPLFKRSAHTQGPPACGASFSGP